MAHKPYGVVFQTLSKPGIPITRWFDDEEEVHKFIDYNENKHWDFVVEEVIEYDPDNAEDYD